ncbi:MarR family winged helix-turn-helix transcriptional regulator [Macrococcoides caseolyticum]|uniref:MarR family winged helix-turn-helix transcriptional regulator n=1 Tax=Macrococcoides caseolyticum TaxID=69966 RepID=UPI001F3EBC93|nr:MarR family transcriptional regulator [Macrococcus caseolyticus]MCE4956607.1 MarR family transcriptional regulator [Macrococcus caseolyticus]
MDTKGNKLSKQLCFSYYNVNRLFNQFYKTSLKAFNLTYTQYLALVSLWDNPSQTLHELGKELDLASNTLTPLLKRLEEKGYVVRLRPEKDKRQLVIQLTEEGRRLQHDVENHLVTCFSSIDGLSEEKAVQLIEENQRLIEQLQRLSGK